MPQKRKRIFQIISLDGHGSWPGPGGKAAFCFSLGNNHRAATAQSPYLAMCLV